QVGGKYSSLAFEAKNGAVNVWLVRPDAYIVGKITSGKVIGAVHYQVVVGHQFRRILAGEPLLVQIVLHMGIYLHQPVASRFQFGSADVGSAVKDLSLKI